MPPWSTPPVSSTLSGSTEFARVNHRGTLAVLDAASRAQVGRFVHLSSNSPFGTNAFPGDAFRQHEPYRPYLGYGESKMHAEIEVRAAHERGDVADGDHPAAVVLRALAAGSGRPASSRWWQRAVSRSRATAASSGRWRTSTTWSRGSRWRSAIRRRPARRSGSPTATPTRWARWWPRCAGRSPRRVSARRDGVRPGSAGAGGRGGDAPTASCSGAAATSPRSTCSESWSKTIACDISRTVEVLGYEPRVGLLEGMRRSIRWCVSQGVDIAPPARPEAPA